MNRKLMSVAMRGMVSAVVMAVMCGCADENRLGTSVTGHITASVDLDSKAITSKGRSADEAAVSVGDLAVSIVAEDGSYSHTWASVDQFPTDQEFNVGRYTLTAFYGAATDEGFEKPYYYGETQVNVVADRTTAATLTATLANAMVSVDYTDAFIGYMADYSAELQGKSIFFAKNENRAAYVVPGPVSLNVSVTKPNGKSATLNAAAFTAEARHHYHITVDVNEGGVGDAVLTIIFDDMLDQESVSIDLSDELFDAPTPQFTCKGVESGETIEIVEGSKLDRDIQFNLIAKGGMKQVNLYTSSVALKEAGWQPSLDLMSATDAQRAAITQLGFEAIGLWKNPGQMAVLDFSGVPTHIGYVENADNVSSFTLSATDLMNKVSEEISFSVKVLPVLLNVSCPQNPRLGDNTIVLEVEYNGSDIAEMLSFQYANERGSWTNFTVVSITGMSDGHYSVVLSTPDDSSNLRVRAVYVNGRTSDTLDVMREVPPFSLKVEDIDIYARSAKATLECETVPAELIAANAVYAVSADGGEFRDIDVVADGALLDLSGLVPGTSYTLRATAGSEQASVSFETEAAAQLPNSGMEQWTRVDGKTRYWWIDYPGESTSAVWGTMNLLTTSVGNGNTNIFDHKGTSYCAFSGTRYVDNDVHSGSYAAIISTVGWGDNDANGSTSTGKGCKNLTVGELYLGHYDASVQKAVYTGIDFGSRPSEFSFWYKYVHKNSADFGTAEIVIKDASGNIIATNSVELRAVNSYTQVKLPLDYTVKSKAANVMVAFKSSGNPDCQSINTTNLSCPSFGNLSDGRFTGSEMYIDDIELIY